VLAIFYVGVTGYQEIPEPGVKHLSVCGNGKLERGEDCESCPQEFSESQCACFYQNLTVQALDGEEAYLCLGKKVEFKDVTASLIETGEKAGVFFEWVDGTNSTVFLERGKQAQTLYVGIEFKKQVEDGIIVSFSDFREEIEPGQEFVAFDGSSLKLKDKEISVETFLDGIDVRLIAKSNGQSIEKTLGIFDSVEFSGCTFTYVSQTEATPELGPIPLIEVRCSS
jgi:hypothetical protein